MKMLIKLSCDNNLKKSIRKIIISLLLFVTIITNSIFAQINLNQLRENEHDFDNTYFYLVKGPELAYGGDLIVLGDSYGFLFCEYVDKGVNYIVHQGYTISKIHNEFLHHVKKDTYKYAFLLIGPNDFNKQTDIDSFKSTLQMVIDDLKSKGIQVIMTDYCDPNYNGEGAAFLFNNIKCWQYDVAIKELIVSNGLIYVEMRDLLLKYGWLPEDVMHPNKQLYVPLMERIEDAIEKDKAWKALIFP